LQDVLTGEILPAGFRTYDNGAAFVALRQTRNSQFEGTQKITSTQTFAYDLLGNVTTYIDFAAGNPADRIEVKITYHDNNSLYLKSIPKSQQVITPEGVLRQRETEIDGKGNITKITQNIDNTGNKAVYDFEYDNFGNLKKVTRPANYKGQRMFFEYEYDPVLNALPIKVKDAFGYESSSSYEYRFATLLQTTDLNNNQIFYTTDNRGRVSTITAPYETDAGKPYTIKFQYFTDRSLSGAEAYTITRHAMPEGNEVLTYTFVDGLMRPLQVKKTSSLFTGENQPDQKAMVVSGWNIYDGFGRVVETYQSVVENLGTETQINLSRNPIQPTRTTYDTRDRTTSTTLPDGATSTISYDLKIFPVLSVLDQLFEVTQTDPNGGIIKSYTDAKQRQRAMSQMLNGEDVFTISHYNALGEVLEVENTKGEKTKYVYDLLGRRLSVNHPDAGLTEFEYDNANNLLKKITPNLRAWSSRSLSGAEANAGADLQSVPSNFFIEYKYDFNRLMEIIYPKNVQNYVQYEYGEPNADHNRAGRLVLVQDASGGTEYFYDALGNITKTIRSILVSSSDLRTYVSEENYDSWGRIQKMIYPDGEVVNYEYNLAGNLRAMHSQKDGRTYEIIKQLGYNEDEQKVFKLLGNGTKTTYTYEPERKRLATMFAGKGNHVLFDNIYSYDLVDNITGIENNADVPMLNEGLGGATKNTYVYDEWNRLIFAKGSVETAKVRGTKEYELTMQYDKLYNITNKNQKVFHRSYNAGADLQSVPEQTHDFFYRYEDPNHPNAPTSIGSKNYQYDPNGNPIFIHDTATDAMRRMIWDEENRLILLSDDGNANNYIYDHAGERVIKAQATIQSVYIDGLPAGMLSSNKNHTIYVSPNMVARNDGFTKHYYAGTERVLSKLGGGTFNNRYSLTNQTITAGNKNYIQRMSQLQAGIDEHYKELQFPPGNPVFPNHAGQPEQTGNPIPTTPGTYEIPRGWPRDPITAPPGGPPGPPIQWGEPITNDNVTAGYTYRPNTLEEREQYFYHPDHLGSTSIITDKEGRATQFIAYLPFGEALVDEHTTRREMPFKFNGKEIDSETGLYYYGARYYDPRTAIWKGVDPLAEKYPNVGGYVYCINNPIRVIDPDGREIVIVGDEQYQATIKDYLNQLSASGKAGKFLVNQAIKSKRTFVIANTKDDVESNVLHKNKDATILTFNLSNQSTNLDEKNGGVAKSPLTSLAHELAHFNNPQDGRLLDAKGSGTSIPAGEVQAIEWENRVRKDLGMDERKMYNGIDVYGKEISPSQYKGFYNLQNKRGYGGNDGYSPINGIPKESLENRRTYQIQGQFFDRFLKNPQYKKQLRIKF
jgi:RHS repeat-associated protein